MAHIDATTVTNRPGGPASPPARRRPRRLLWWVLAIVAVLAVLIAIIIGGYLRTNVTYYDRQLDALAAAGFVSKQVEIDGYLSNYAEGPRNGPSLVLIHGQGSKWQDYMMVLPELAERFHVFAVDVPGHGGSDRLPPDQYRNARVGALLAEFIATVSDEPVILSGHSSGALLAAWIAANRPELVSGVVLEDPPFYSSIMPRAASTTGGAIFDLAVRYIADPDGGFTRFFVERGDYFAFFGGFKTAIVNYALGYIDAHPGEPLEIYFLPPFVNIFFRGLDDYDPAFGAAWFDNGWYEGFDTDATLSSIAVPTTLVHTTYWRDQNGTYYEDGILMAAMDGQDKERTMSQLRDVELVEVASGHLVHFERPREYLQAVFELSARIADRE